MAENLTPAQYRFIERVQKEELRITNREQKVNVLSVYLDQAKSLLSFIASSPANVFTNTKDAIKRFAEIDLFISNFNEEIAPVLESGEDQMIELSAFQTEEILLAANFSFSFGAEFARGTDKLIKDTRKYNNNFSLAESIWGEDKRDQFYKQILDGINSGLGRNEITNILEDRLLKKGNGGQFYNVERILDTEYNNVYRLGKVEAAREWNNESDGNDPIIYTWNLSPAHKVKDICDDLEGGYELESQVPSTPHPNCKCYSGQKFKSDFTGRMKSLRVRGGVYKSPNYKNQQALMV